MTESDALEVMTQGRGTQFDPFLFGVFVALVPELRRISFQNPDESLDDRGGELKIDDASVGSVSLHVG
jgi:hypothetical protein